MAEKARRFVRENFLLTRHLREYLTLMVAIDSGGGDQVEVQ
jgi:trehalose synthase